MDTARAEEFGEQTSFETYSELANAGTHYTNSYASAPWTLPSHAALFTATYSSRHGAHAGHKHLNEDLTRLSEAFSQSGYQTVGFSNNTWVSGEFGFQRGFDNFLKGWQYIQSENDLSDIAREKEGLNQVLAAMPRIIQGNPIVNVANTVYGKFIHKQSDYGANRTNSRFKKWLSNRETEQPFFTFINYLEPHLEYQPPKAHAERYLPEDVPYEEALSISQDAWAYISGKNSLDERDFKILKSLYRAEIAYVDDRINELQTMLQEAGEWEDTVFVITGDHGENIGDHGFMDHQYCLYDTLLHVPLVIHGGEFTGGDTVNDLVQLTDLGPTLLDAAGIDAPKFREQAQGRSLHPDANTSDREFAFAEYMAPQPSMEALEQRVGTLPESVREYDRSLRVVRTEKWKLIRGSDGLIELYNVDDDPKETENVADENPDQVSTLESKLDEWLASFEHAENDKEVSMREQTKQRLEDLGYIQ